MAFIDFTRQRPGVIDGRIAKRRSPTPTRKTSIAKHSNQLSSMNVTIKTEPTGNDLGFGFDHETAEWSDKYHQRSAAKGTRHANMESDVVLPSIETPDYGYQAVVFEPLGSERLYNLISGLRGGELTSNIAITPTEHKLKTAEATSVAEGSSASFAAKTRRPKENPSKFHVLYVGNQQWEIPLEVENDYERLKRANKGSNKWTDSEAELHRILSLRGYHPLMPGEWKRDFAGINLEEILFAPVGCKKPVVLRNVSEGLNAQFRATKALTRIFTLSSRVADHLKFSERGGEKAAKLIEAEVRRYMAWAERDAGIYGFNYAPNVGVYRVRNVDCDANDLVATLDALMDEWTDNYLQWYQDKGTKAASQTLFGLFVLHHLVLVLTADISKPQEPSRCLVQLDLSRSDNRWLDHALNLAIPINMARDIKANEVKGNSDFAPVSEDTRSDPDA